MDRYTSADSVPRSNAQKPAPINTVAGTIDRRDSSFYPLSPATSTTPLSPMSPYGSESPNPQRQGSFYRPEQPASPTSSPYLPRNNSDSSASSAATSTAPNQPYAAQRSNTTGTVQSKRNSGNYMQYGRHSNEWLFGGISVTETVKGWIHPKN
ncbi:MAG: hypothetical protein M1824_003094 [Vezdaea acicularis]|nr:MAG: hypothetical protein M1824_003094 [Vezdaea acicularis]